MVHVFRCPTCGHKYSIPEEKLGSKVVCKECEEVFPLTLSKALPEPTSRPGKKADQPRQAKILQKVLGDTSAAVDGAIPAAISGILAGVLVPILVSPFSSVSVGD